MDFPKGLFKSIFKASLKEIKPHENKITTPILE